MSPELMSVVIGNVADNTCIQRGQGDQVVWSPCGTAPTQWSAPWSAQTPVGQPNLGITDSLTNVSTLSIGDQFMSSGTGQRAPVTTSASGTQYNPRLLNVQGQANTCIVPGENGRAVIGGGDSAPCAATFTYRPELYEPNANGNTGLYYIVWSQGPRYLSVSQGGQVAWVSNWTGGAEQQWRPYRVGVHQNNGEPRRTRTYAMLESVQYPNQFLWSDPESSNIVRLNSATQTTSQNLWTLPDLEILQRRQGDLTTYTQVIVPIPGTTATQVETRTNVVRNGRAINPLMLFPLPAGAPSLPASAIVQEVGPNADTLVEIVPTTSKPRGAPDSRPLTPQQLNPERPQPQTAPTMPPPPVPCFTPQNAQYLTNRCMGGWTLDANGRCRDPNTANPSPCDGYVPREFALSPQVTQAMTGGGGQSFNAWITNCRIVNQEGCVANVRDPNAVITISKEIPPPPPPAPSDEKAAAPVEPPIVPDLDQFDEITFPRNQPSQNACMIGLTNTTTRAGRGQPISDRTCESVEASLSRQNFTCTPVQPREDANIRLRCRRNVTSVETGTTGTSTTTGTGTTGTSTTTGTGTTGTAQAGSAQQTLEKEVSGLPVYAWILIGIAILIIIIIIIVVAVKVSKKKKQQSNV